MPYDSNAQRRFFHANMGKKKGITPKVVDEYDQASKGEHLPERVGKKKKPSARHKRPVKPPMPDGAPFGS